MKYFLLYLGLVPTGNIDDSDKVHSNDIEQRKTQQTKPTLTDERFKQFCKLTTEEIKEKGGKYEFTKEQRSKLSIIIEERKNNS